MAITPLGDANSLECSQLPAARQEKCSRVGRPARPGSRRVRGSLVLAALMALLPAGRLLAQGVVLPQKVDGASAASYLSGLQVLANMQASDRRKWSVWRRAEVEIEHRMAAVAAAAQSGQPSEDDAGQLSNLLASVRVAKNRVEAGSLHLDFFAATVFSNLYRDPKTQGYFDESRGFLLTEFDQQLTSWGPTDEHSLGTFGLVSFQSTGQGPTAPAPTPSPSPTTPAASAAGTTAATPDLIAAVTGFNFEGGFITTHPLGKSLVSWSPFVGAGFAGVPDPDKPDAGDTFHWTAHAGIRLRQVAGTFRGTYTEFAYLRDPRFQSPDRFQVLGRIVLSPEIAGSNGKGLGAYIEGAVNVGRGKDEVRITAGVRIDALGVLRALVGADASADGAASPPSGGGAGDGHGAGGGDEALPAPH